MKDLLELAEEIRHGIPSHYHVTLEDRLAIAWGDGKRNQFNGKRRTQSELLKKTRENNARVVYRQAQDEGCLLFLSFILAYSPRACVGFQTTEFTKFRENEWVKMRLKAGAEIKELLRSIAFRKGLSHNRHYLRFIETMFPEGSQKPEPIVVPVDAIAMKSMEEGDRPSSIASLVSTCTNTAPNETPNETQVTLIPNVTSLQQHLVLMKAPLEGAATVFDEDMFRAIRRDKVQSDGMTSPKAAVTMDFPPSGLVDCLMSLEIDQSKVAYLAMALFKVRVESMGDVRYIVLKEGVRLIPNPETTLKGVLDEAIIKVFGSEIHGAITAGRMRLKELEEGNCVTECVSMILTCRPDEGAIVNLSLSLEEGTQIREKLYT